jgi:hypothetical protein
MLGELCDLYRLFENCIKIEKFIYGKCLLCKGSDLTVY